MPVDRSISGGGRGRVQFLLGHGENSIFDVQVQLAEQFPDVRTVAVIAHIRDRARIEQVFDRYHPAVVFHAAAHKHVPLMEENPEEAVANNVLGTFNVVNAAERCGASHFVLISLDKAVAPVCMMGATKQLAEMVVMSAGRRTGRAYAVVRFGNVLGSRGLLVPFFKRQIECGGPVAVTHPDMRRFFLTIPEAVHLVIEAGGMGRGGELFVLKMGTPTRIVDLATDLIRLSGFDADEIRIVFTALRSGEKLIELLWETDASIDATANGDIVRVVEGRVPGDVEVGRLVAALASAAGQGRVVDLQTFVM